MELNYPCIVATAEAPRGASVPTGAEDLGQTICKLVAVVAEGAISSKLAAIVSGTPLNAISAQVTVSCRRTLSAPRALAAVSLSCYGSIRITLHR